MTESFFQGCIYLRIEHFPFERKKFVFITPPSLCKNKHDLTRIQLFYTKLHSDALHSLRCAYRPQYSVMLVLNVWMNHDDMIGWLNATACLKWVDAKPAYQKSSEEMWIDTLSMAKWRKNSRVTLVCRNKESSTCSRQRCSENSW